VYRGASTTSVAPPPSTPNARAATAASSSAADEEEDDDEELPPLQPPLDEEGASDEEEGGDDEDDDDEVAPTPKMHKDKPSPAIKKTGKTIALGSVVLKLLIQLADPRPLQVSPTASAEDLVSNLMRTLDANTIAATVDGVDQGTALVHHRSGAGTGAIGFTLILEFRSLEGGMEIVAMLEKMGLVVTIVAPGRMRQAADTSKAAGKRPVAASSAGAVKASRTLTRGTR
jgi:hypothetical protein